MLIGIQDPPPPIFLETPPIRGPKRNLTTQVIYSIKTQVQGGPPLCGRSWVRS
jgi:hypothetical protein